MPILFSDQIFGQVWPSTSDPPHLLLLATPGIGQNSRLLTVHLQYYAHRSTTLCFGTTPGHSGVLCFKIYTVIQAMIGFVQSMPISRTFQCFQAYIFCFQNRCRNKEMTVKKRRLSLLISVSNASYLQNPNMFQSHSLLGLMFFGRFYLQSCLQTGCIS